MKKQTLILKTESQVQAFKDSLMQSVANTTPLLTNCYINWLAAQMRNERYDLELTHHPNVVKHSKAKLHAWERADELFRELAPVVLDELLQAIAAQVELEFKDVDELAASDVPFALRNVDLFDLIEHIN